MFVRSTLKKIVTLMLCALCVLSALTSCLYLPDDEGELEFDSTFYDTYFVEDYNLRHLDMNQSEDDVRVSTGGKPSRYYWSVLRVARIPETDPDLFLLGTREKGPYIGGSQREFFIYQSLSAPIPRKDWTIADIKIFPGALKRLISSSSYRTYYRTWMENAETLYSWREEGEDPTLLEELRKTLQSVPIVKKEGRCVEVVHRTDGNEQGQRVTLCVTFEENPHIAWFATVYVAEKGYYLGHFLNDSHTSLEEVDTYYIMGESWNLLLDDMFHGMEQFETDTAESE